MNAEVLSRPEVLRAIGRGEVNDEILGALNTSSRRRILVLLELVRRAAAEGDPTDRAVSLVIGRWLARARVDQPGLEDLLADPLLGIWAASTVRDEVGAGADDALAHLAAPEVALGERIEVPLVAPGGLVHLARCGGTVDLGGRTGRLILDDGAVRVVTEDGEVVVGASVIGGDEVAARGDLRWIPDKYVDVEPFGPLLAWSDPTGARVGPSPVVEFTDGVRKDWYRVTTAAWRMISADHARYAPGVAGCCRMIVPQRSDDPHRHVSSTNADGFGAVGVSLTEDIPTFAVALIHEVQHLKLSALLDAVPLHGADSVPRYYAGWRPDPRPFQPLMHGVFAFSAVTEFWRVAYERETDPVYRTRYGLEYARWAAQTTASLTELLEAGVVTPEGGHFLAGIEEVAQRWAPPAEPGVAEAVADTIAEHRMNWELERAGAPALGTRLRLAWQYELVGSDDPRSVDDADRAVVTERGAAALRGARDRVSADPESLDDWFRLARALHHHGEHAEAERIAELLVEAAAAEREDRDRLFHDAGLLGVGSTSRTT